MNTRLPDASAAQAPPSLLAPTSVGAAARLVVLLQGGPEQQRRLMELRALFTQACNALAPQVAQTRCWNRVALHHMAYKPLRERFPQLGSQMACNVIYSVSRAARLAYQHPASPYNLARTGHQLLPIMRFKGPVPVYFDRHTLSVRAGEVSLFTLDGRIRFKVDLSPEMETRFRTEKLREVVLAQRSDGAWGLTFDFAFPAEAEAPVVGTDWPEYLVLASTQDP